MRCEREERVPVFDPGCRSSLALALPSLLLRFLYLDLTCTPFVRYWKSLYERLSFSANWVSYPPGSLRQRIDVAPEY